MFVTGRRDMNDDVSVDVLTWCGLGSGHYVEGVTGRLIESEYERSEEWRFCLGDDNVW